MSADRTPSATADDESSPARTDSKPTVNTGAPLRAAQVLRLQRSIGNQSTQAFLARRVRPAPAAIQRHANSEFNDQEEEEQFVKSAVQRSVDLSAQPIVQRAIWTFDGTNWRNGQVVGDASSEQFKTLPKKRTFLAGDRFDDASGRLYSSSNAKVLGLEGKLYGHYPVDPKDEQAVRDGISAAKVALQQALTKTTDAMGKKDGPDDAFRRVLRLAFNIPENESAKNLQKALNIISEALRQIITGLETRDLPIIRAAEKVRVLLVTSMDMTTAAGYVERGLTEIGGFEEPVKGPERFAPVSGQIHINWKVLSSPESTMRTLVHEASHKFLGTWDYTYGVDSGQGTDAWLKEQAEKFGLNESQLVSRFVWEAVATSVSSVLSKGFGYESDVPPKYKRMAMAAVNLKNQLIQAAPDAREPKFQEVIEGLMKDPVMTSGVRSQLATLADPAKRGEFIAHNAKFLDIKGPTLLFVIPSGYLLNNADSYMDYVAALGK